MVRDWGFNLLGELDGASQKFRVHSGGGGFRVVWIVVIWGIRRALVFEARRAAINAMPEAFSPKPIT